MMYISKTETLVQLHVNTNPSTPYLLKLNSWGAVLARVNWGEAGNNRRGFTRRLAWFFKLPFGVCTRCLVSFDKQPFFRNQSNLDRIYEGFFFNTLVPLPRGPVSTHSWWHAPPGSAPPTKKMKMDNKTTIRKLELNDNGLQ